MKLAKMLMGGILLFIGIRVQAQVANLPEMIVVERGDLMPEGIEYDAEKERFLLSSMAEGHVYAVADDGTLTPLVQDAALIASLGLEIDGANKRLLVAGADLSIVDNPENKGTAQLGVYDLETGERLHLVDLGALLPNHRHLANDIALDDEGNAYITDSLAPAIYKVDTEGNASILVQDDRLLIDGFGGNGIVYHPDGYLIVGISGVELFKVPLENPEEMSMVETDQTIGADGMIWHPDGELIVVSNGDVLALVSKDNWQTATVTKISRNHPATTAALRDDEIFVIYPSYGSRANPESRIVRVDLEEIAS